MKSNSVIRPEFYCSEKQLHFRLDPSCKVRHGDLFSLYESEDGFVLIPETDGLWKVWVVPNRLPGFFILSRNEPVRRIKAILESVPDFRYERHENSFHIILNGNPLNINDMKKFVPDRYTLKKERQQRGPYYIKTETGEKRTFVRLCSESVYFPYQSVKALFQIVRVSFYKADGLFGIFPDRTGLLKIRSDRKCCQFRIYNNSIYQYLLKTTGQRTFSHYRQDGDRFYFGTEPIVKIPARESFQKIEPFYKRHNNYIELYDRWDQKLLMAYIGRNLLTPRVSFYRYKNVWALVSESEGTYGYLSKDATIHCADLLPQLRKSLHCGEYAKLFTVLRNGIVYFQNEPFVKPPPHLKMFTRIT